MLKEIFKDGAIYTFTNLITKGISFFLIPIYTKYFSPDDYGLLEYLNVISFLFAAVFSFQLNQGIARFIADGSLTKAQKIDYTSSTFFFYLLSFGILFFGLFFSKEIISTLFIGGPSNFQSETYFYFCISSFLIGISYFLGVILRFTRNTLFFTVTNLIHALLVIVILIYLITKLNYGIEGVFLSNIIVTPFSIILQFLKVKGFLKFKFDISRLWEVLRYSIPLIPSAISIIIINFSDRYFINEYSSNGLFDLGLYSVAFKFSTILGIVVSSFSTALSPIVFNQVQSLSLSRDIGRFFKAYFVLGSVITIFLILFSKELLFLMASASYSGAEKVLPILFLFQFINGFLMFGIALEIKKKTKVIAGLVIVFSLINLLLNYLFTPKFGSVGAALASLITSVIYVLTKIVIAQKFFKIDFSKKKILLPVLFILSTIYAVYLLDYGIEFRSIFFRAIVFFVYLELLLSLGFFKISFIKVSIHKIFKG